MIRNGFPTTLPAFAARFATDEACWEYLRDTRWPRGFVCPRDGLPAVTYISTRKLWECPKGHQTSVTSRTVLEGTRKSICTWFWAAYFMSTYTPGTSAYQFARQFGLRYETAYQMLQHLRAAMVNPEREPLHGTVEVDEAFLYGKKTGAMGRQMVPGKYMIAAAVERRGRGSGRVRLKRIYSGGESQLRPFLEKNVTRGSTIVTDSWLGYQNAKKWGYTHRVVKGASSVEVSKQLPLVHRVFSNLKTWLLGTYHGVSGKHLQAYLNEFTFRFNRRRNPKAAFDRLLGLSTHLPGPEWKQLYRAGEPGGWVHPNGKPQRAVVN